MLYDGLTVGKLDLSTLDEIQTVIIADTCHISFLNQTALPGVNFTTKYASSSFSLRGSEFDDSFDVTNSAMVFQIDGGKGNDTLTAGAHAAALLGSAGNDRLYGGAKNDALSGGEDNDLLHGDDGNDIIEGNGIL